MLASTDALAITAVLRRAGGPESIVTLMEGESLLNDASGERHIVASFKVLTAALMLSKQGLVVEGKSLLNDAYSGERLHAAWHQSAVRQGLHRVRGWKRVRGRRIRLGVIGGLWAHGRS